MPAQWRPSCSAATQAVAQPQNGSRTRSPSLDEARMIRCRSASGFWVGKPVRSRERLWIGRMSSQIEPGVMVSSPMT